MPRETKSQWDFGELFPAEQLRHVLTVSELTATVRRLLEQHLGRLWVSGEITNLRVQSSGHIYFTLKDAVAQVGCVLFRAEAVPNRALLQDGQKVILQGDLTVYEARGQYQLVVRAVELQGIGALQIAFERLKQKLAAEGLFDPARKRPIPRYPQRIGLVTSPTGAAIRDVLHVVRRRHPGLEIVLAPCCVQGEGAALQIATAIRLINQYNLQQSTPAAAGTPARAAIALILVTRGGGSLEDLWAFNEETVARAIYESQVPVISAVGHEIDFTISDFVADLRAATPSAGAELITEGAFASRRFMAEVAGRLRAVATRRLHNAREEVGQLRRRLARAHPRRELEARLQYLDDLQERLHRCTRQGFHRHRLAAETLRLRLLRLRPSARLGQHQQWLHELLRRLLESARHRLQSRHGALDLLQARLHLLSPESVLARGYSITTDTASGRVLRSASQVREGTRVKTMLHRGHLLSVVERRELPESS